MSGLLLIQDLKLHIKGEVLSDAASLGMYSTDASLYQIQPVAVVLPKDEADVQTAIRIAVDHKTSILPRGGGTSLAGQTVGQSMILDFSKYMNQILEVNVEEKWAIVQPGLVRDVLNQELQKHNLHFAPDPATSSRANVGGMIGNNSSGTKSILYGKTVDHILELKVALADGTIMQFKDLSISELSNKAERRDREGDIYKAFRQLIFENQSEIEKRFPKVMRRVQGYNLDEFAGKKDWNLSKLICGSEGTLGVILEAKINLEQLPKYKSLCVVHYHDFLETIRSVEPILNFNPAAVEILDKHVIELSRENLETSRLCHFIEGDPEAILIVEFYGDTEEAIQSRAQQMIGDLQQKDYGYAYPVFSDESSMQDVWTVRKKGLGLMLGVKTAEKPLAFIEDAAIPIEHLPKYMEEVLELCAKYETKVAAYAHASVGVIHVRPFLDLRQEEHIEKFKIIAQGTFDLVKKYGGSWSGEHGDGLVRSPFLKDYFGEQIYEALKQVKQLFDPQNLMNPGKIIDAPPIDENLRYGAQYADQKVETIFKYREDQSFANAVHLCTGVGECRKTFGGTMCPSFRATREEEHSTRGRANILRLAISGQLGQAGLLDERVKDALDLCLSCKACKSECPSNVDMAKLKSEIWQKRFEEKGIPIRDRFVRHSTGMARLFSGRLAPLVNFVQGTKLFRWVLEKIVGIDKRRILPTYKRSAALQSRAKQDFDKVSSNGPALESRATSLTMKVALFADTYLNYHDPNIGIAAKNLLENLGYEVIIADVGCCQRPRISQGFLKDAKKDGLRTALHLDKYLQAGIPVVVCEPSCAAALNDDLPDLLEDEELAQRLKAGVKMIDIFLSEDIEMGILDEFSFPMPKHHKIHIHGHCHQKALYGTKSMKHILEGIGVEVSEIPSGCCGMAGSFGYEKEHYELSKKVGEEVLFPAIEKIGKDEVIVACGFSCRHQIDHFCGRESKHWVEVFEDTV